MHSPTPQLLIFDVNETLLDLSPMKTRMNEVFQHAFAFEKWFSLMLQYSLVDTVTQQYHNFGEIGKAAFQMTGQALETHVPDQQAKEILTMIRKLPPHPDVIKGLEMLNDAGYQMVTLTNSAPDVLQQQMEYAGLTHFFTALLSIDEIRKYKPASATYQACLKKQEVEAGEAMLIAAHGWDVAGALQAGLQAAFVARKGKTLYPLAPPPQISEDTLIRVAEKLTQQ